LASTFRKAEHELIEILQQVESHGVHKQLGFRSMFQYVTESLRLSENYAYALITVARKAREVPALKIALKQEEISVNQAKKISSVITKENDRLWIDRVKRMTQREVEKEVAKANPTKAVCEKMKYVQGDRLQFQCGISEKLMTRLRRAQDVLSQKKKLAASLEETLEAMVSLYLEREDPVQRAERNVGKSSKRVLRPEAAGKRVPVPAEVRHSVNARDRGRCTHVDDKGKRCTSLHHVRPISHGGANTTANIVTLCHLHHRLMHRNRVQEMSPPCR
jgi:hypothetical protein